MNIFFKSRSPLPVAALLALLSVAALLPATAQTWDGGGADDLWSTANNWNPNSTPTFNNQTDITFYSSATRLTNALGASRTIRSLTFDDNVDSAVSIRMQNITANTGGSARNLTLASSTGTSNITVTSGSTANIGIISAYGGAIRLSNNLVITHNGSGALSFRNFNDAPVTSAPYPSLTFDGSGTVHFGGNLSLRGEFFINGGTVRLGGTGTVNPVGNLFENNVTINGGTVDLATFAQTVENAGVVTLQSGTITGTTGSLTSTSAFEMQGGTVSGILAGSVGLNKSTSGSVTLSGANTYTGATSISAGTLRASHANALGTTAAGTTVSSGAALELSGAITIGSEALGLSGTGVSSGGALRNISGNNTYQGAITLNAASRINSDANTLTLSGTIGGAGQNLTVGGAGNTTLSGVIGTTTGTLTKDGAGTLTLGAANTYSGTTTVSAGTLALGLNGSISSSTTIDVRSGAFLDTTAKTSGFSITSGQTLMGNGTVKGATTIASGATLSPGASPGILTFENALTLAGTTIMEIDGTAGAGVDPGGHDQIKLTGTGANGALTYGGALTLDIGTIFGNGYYFWDLFDFASETGTFSSITLSDQASGSLTDGNADGIWEFSSGGRTWTFTESTGGLSLVVVVPEPGSALLGGGICLLALLRRRR